MEKKPIRKPRAMGPRKKSAVALKAKKPIKLEISEEHVVAAAPKPVVHKIATDKEFYAVGKRKTAVAQILVKTGSGNIAINKLPFEKYFMTEDLQTIVLQPMVSIGMAGGLDIRAKIHGGGIHAQAEGLRHAISRALIQMSPDSRRVLKKQGFLTRDPRVKERKKPGLKRARRAPQFSKR